MNRQDALEKLAPISNLSQVSVLERPRVALLRGGTSVINSTELDMSATKNLFDVIGIPDKFTKELSLNTLRGVVSDMFPQNVTILTRDGQGIGVYKGKNHKSLSPEYVFNGIDTMAKYSYDINKVTVNKSNYSAFIEIPMLDEIPVYRGDLIRGGTMIEFSPVGTIKPKIYSYAVRMICTNGAISTDNIFTFTGEDDTDYNTWFVSSFDSAISGFNGILDSYKSMYNTKVNPNDRAAILSYMLKEAGLGKDANKAIRIRATNEPIETMYDVYNLATWASSHIVEDPERIIGSMRRIGNFVLDHNKHLVCPFCSTVKELN